MTNSDNENDIGESVRLLSSMLGREIVLGDVPHDLGRDHSRASSPDEKLVRHVANPSPPSQRVPAKNPTVSQSSNAEQQTEGVKPPPYFDLEQGELAPKGVEFTSWIIASAYPDSYIGKTNKPLAKPFWDKRFDDFRWDFFYLYSSDRHKHHRPFLLVPTNQFVYFLERINKALGICLTIPEGGEKYFNLNFGRAGAPLPRYLGKVDSEDSYALVKDKKNIPPMGLEHDEWNRAPAPVAEEYTELLDAVYNFSLGTPASRQKRLKKAQINAARRESMMVNFLREIGVVPGGSFGYALVNLEQPLPFFKTDKAAVIMSVDVEALELSPHSISEIGLAFLDLEKVKDMAAAPGAKGESWWEHIVSWHVRVREYSGLRNFKYVHGCPDDFDFGNSTFPPKDQTLDHLQKILTRHVEFEQNGEKGLRDIILVAHDISADEKYLAELGLDLRTLNIILKADTKEMHQHYRKLSQGRGLSDVLNDVDIHHKHLHNAGNDANYTLKASIACGLAYAKQQGEKAAQEKHAAKNEEEV